MVNPNCRTLGVGLMVAGIFMSEIKPRHAASYHSMEEALAGVRDGIRETYDGPPSHGTSRVSDNL